MLKKTVALLLCVCFLLVAVGCNQPSYENAQREVDFPKDIVVGLINKHLGQKYEGTQWETMQVDADNCKSNYLDNDEGRYLYGYTANCGEGLQVKFVILSQKRFIIKDNFQSEKLFAKFESQVQKEYFPQNEIKVVPNFVVYNCAINQNLFLEKYMPETTDVLQFFMEEVDDFYFSFVLFVKQTAEDTEDAFYSATRRLDEDCAQRFDAFMLKGNDFHHAAQLVGEGLTEPIKGVGYTAEDKLMDSLYRGIYQFERIRSLYDVPWAYCEKITFDGEPDIRQRTAVDYPVAPGVTFVYFESSPETSSRFITLHPGIPVVETLSEQGRSYSLDKTFTPQELAEDKWGNEEAIRMFPITKEVEYTASKEGFYGFEIHVNTQELYASYDFEQYENDELYAWIYYPETGEWDTQFPAPAMYKPGEYVFLFNYFDEIADIEKFNIFISIYTPLVTQTDTDAA